MATGILAISDFETTSLIDGSELVLISKKDGNLYISKNTAISSLPFINGLNYASDTKAGVVKVGNKLTIDKNGVLDVNVKKINLDLYLPLSGGTMDGLIKSIAKVALAKADSDSYLEIDGGSSSATGAQLALAGESCDIDYNGKASGSFELIAKAVSKESKLVGLPNGLLQWKKDNILRSVNSIKADGDGNANIPNASETQDGLMTSTDFKKLSDIEEDANNYVLPVATNNILGGVKIGSGINITKDGTLSVPVSGVTKLKAGNNITINPVEGTGEVTIAVGQSGGEGGGTVVAGRSGNVIDMTLTDGIIVLEADTVAAPKLYQLKYDSFIGCMVAPAGCVVLASANENGPWTQIGIHSYQGYLGCFAKGTWVKSNVAGVTVLPLKQSGGSGSGSDSGHGCLIDMDAVDTIVSFESKAGNTREVVPYNCKVITNDSTALAKIYVVKNDISYFVGDVGNTSIADSIYLKAGTIIEMTAGSAKVNFIPVS